jgi:hypothetical protein
LNIEYNTPWLRKLFFPQHTEMDFWGPYNPKSTPEWREAWDITQKLILKIKGEAEAHHAQLLLVSLTNGDFYIDKSFLNHLKRYAPINWDIDKPDKILAEFCQEHSIPFLALTPLYRDYVKNANQPLKFHYQYDGHWKAEGHRVAAEFIYQKLMEMGL